MLAKTKLASEPQSDRDEVRLLAMIHSIREVVMATRPEREVLHAIFLDSSRGYVADQTYGHGKIAALSLRMRDLFGRALAVGASGIILAHNHPSGVCRPSLIDIESTHRLVDICKALDIELIDHLIMTQNSIYSMRAGGIL